MKKNVFRKKFQRSPQIYPSQKTLSRKKKIPKKSSKFAAEKINAISNVAPLNFGPYTNSFPIFYLLPLRLKFMETSNSSFTGH
jgi:hypothetical protein